MTAGSSSTGVTGGVDEPPHRLAMCVDLRHMEIERSTRVQPFVNVEVVSTIANKHPSASRHHL